MLFYKLSHKILNVQYWRDITTYINEVILLELIFCAVKFIIAKGKKCPKLMTIPNQCQVRVRLVTFLIIISLLRSSRYVTVPPFNPIHPKFLIKLCPSSPRTMNGYQHKFKN